MLTILEIEGQAFRSTQKEQNMERSWVQKSKAYLWDMQVKKKKKKEQSSGEGWDWKMKLLGQVRQD